MKTRKLVSSGLTTKTFLTLVGLAVALALAPATRAATISWTGSNISYPADVSTNGTPVGAMNMDSPSPQTINGVTFVADPGNNNVPMALGSATVSVSWGSGSFNNDFWFGGTGPGGDANYNDALDYARNAAPLANGTVTLGGLTVGNYYEVQLWIVDTRVCCSNRVRTVDGSLAMNSGAGPHIARGVFKADAATQVINITPDDPNAGPQLNLLQLRRIAPNVVLNTNDSGPGSLRQAVADVVSGETITFTNTLSGQTITLTNGEIVLSKNLSIDASGAGGIVVSCSTSNRLFFINAGATNTFTRLTLTGGNTPAYGGAIASQGNLTLNSCILTNNHAVGDGGAVHTLGPLLVMNCTVAGNSGNYGGGLYVYGSVLNVMNSTVSGNSAYIGGGINSSDISASTLILNSTLSGNSAGLRGGGIANFGGTVNLTNTIVSANTAPNNANVYTFYSGANNLVDVTNINLAPLGNYGGPTPTMPPLPGSPAIDAGLDTGSLPATDQRGFARVVGGAVDIGAVEADGTALPGVDYTVVTTTNDTLTGAGGVSLRLAVANAPANATITFAPALSGQTITLTNYGILLNKNLNIDASGLPAGIVVTCDTNAPDLLFYCSGTNVFTRLTLTGGVGAIFIDGSLTLNSCILTNNHAVQSGGAITGFGTLTLNNSTLAYNSAGVRGGAIAHHGTLTLNNSTLADNSSGDYGGAIAHTGPGNFILNSCTLTNNHAVGDGGAVHAQAPLIVTNCTISGNSGGASGGGLACYGPTLSLANSTLAGNTAANLGGGIFNNNGALTINNSTLAGNIATNSGGGLYNNSGTISVTNTIVSGNTAPSSPNIISISSGANNLVDVTNINLAPLGDYGGPTPTMPPLPGSPAIDAGNDAAASGLAYDQRGPGFPRVSGDHVDIGAVEAQLITSSTPVEITDLLSLGDGTFQFGFTNDMGASFRVLATTNVALPATNWLFLGFATETPPGSGQFQFTDPGATNYPQRYYRVKSP